MRELVELVDVVSKHKIKRIDILDQTMDTSSKIGHFYNLLNDDKPYTEDSIAQKLGYRDSKDSAYVKLKYRLKKKLIDTLFFIDFNQPLYTDYQKAFNHSYKDWAAIRLLLNRTARTTAIKLAKNIFNNALKYEFIDLILLLAKDLRYHYGYILQDGKNFNYYDDIINTYTNLFYSELKIEKYIAQFLINYNTLSKNTRLSFFDSEKKKIVEVTNKLKSNSSFRYNFLGYLYICFFLQVQGKNQELLDYCNKAIAFFNKKELFSKNPIFIFNQQKLIALLKLNRYNEAQSLALKLRTIPTPGSINWYITNYYYTITCFHSKNYSDAIGITIESLSHKRFDYLPEAYKQIFKIIQAFLMFVLPDSEAEKINKGTKFKIYKFINDVPYFSKEKRGTNITILILHFLFLIKQKKYNEAIDRVEALKQYSYRYLRKDDNFRSNCFIKMLLQVPKADFHPLRTKRYTTKYYNKLLEEPLSISNQPIDIEIIPFEDLWEITIKQLSANSNIETSVVLNN